jgi:hypothetical protein
MALIASAPRKTAMRFENGEAVALVSGTAPT